MSGGLWAVLSGVSMGVGGLTYRYAATGRVLPIQLNAVLGVCGSILFAWLARDQWRDFSLVACCFGVAGGVSQYAAIWLLRCAMKRGPLAPAWCAMSLGGFVPVIIFSFLFMGETPSFFQGLSLLCGCGTIAAAAAGQGRRDDRPSGRDALRDGAVYAACLVMLLLMIGMLNVLLKYATVLHRTNAAQNLLQTQGNVLMTFVYLGMAGCCIADLTLHRQWVVNRYALGGGAVCTLGALGTYLIILSVIDLPAIRIFVLNSTASILTVALGAALIFREKPTRTWYFVVAFSILAVVLNR